MLHEFKALGAEENCPANYHVFVGVQVAVNHHTLQFVNSLIVIVRVTLKSYKMSSAG